MTGKQFCGIYGRVLLFVHMRLDALSWLMESFHRMERQLSFRTMLGKYTC
nr:hypothetical protein Iba_scaffold546885CG0010 [Ipomoea batatas]